MALGFEYTAKYNLGYDVPFESFSSIDGKYKHNSISGRGRGRFRPIYERAYRHYHDRMGMEMPYTLEAIGKSRPEGLHIQHSSWGTLLYAGVNVPEQVAVNVSTLAQLREAVQKSDQTIVMESGKYIITDLPANSRNFIISGSNNIIDLQGVHIEFPVGASSGDLFLVTGNKNTIRGLIHENTYQDGTGEVSDFSSYNQDRKNFANGDENPWAIEGDGNKVIGLKLIVRGSFPYGYGSIYGIGKNKVFGLQKKSGFKITGKNTLLDGCEIQSRAFGHGIFIQSPADNTTIKNTLVEGRMRLGEDLYQETKLSYAKN